MSNYIKRVESIKPIEVYHAVKNQDSAPHWHTGYLITLTDDGDGVETKNGLNYEPFFHFKSLFFKNIFLVILSLFTDF